MDMGKETQNQNDATERGVHDVRVDALVGQIGISWSQDLEPLSSPSKYNYSSSGNQEFASISWRTWCVESHLERLYARCNELLKRIEEHESLLLKIAVRSRLNAEVI